MKKIFLLVNLCFAVCFNRQQKLFAQNSTRIRISLLTCSPGEELYASFGHSALRVIDSNAVTDIIYNYGTFNFDDPDFYSKFVRGKLFYALSIERPEDFLYSYHAENRSVTEQVLDIAQPEALAIKHFLAENIKEEKRWYKYDFVRDNCTTRLRDILVKLKKPAPQLPPVMPLDFTFRNAIHYYLDATQNYWSKLGIDLLLGSRMDVKMTAAEQQFLPDNLMIALDSTKNFNYVNVKQNLYTAVNYHSKIKWFRPIIFFLLIAFLWLLASFSKNKTLQVLLKWLDGILFFITGLLGCLFIFMWWGTDHFMTKDNYNLLWAIPFNCVAAFYTGKNKKGKSYFLFTSFVYTLLVLSWFFLPQQLNIALLPFVILLMVRSYLIFKSK